MENLDNTYKTISVQVYLMVAHSGQNRDLGRHGREHVEKEVPYGEVSAGVGDVAVDNDTVYRPRIHLLEGYCYYLVLAVVLI